MRGYVLWQEGEKPHLERQEIAVVPLFLLRTGRNNRRNLRRLRRLTGELYRCGVREVALSGDVPREVAQAIPLRRVSPEGLRLGLLDKLVDAFCREQGICLSEAAVRLVSPGTDSRACQIARFLCERARYVEVQAGHGGEALRRMLLREYGVSSGSLPAMEINFGEESGGEVPTLHLGRNCHRQQVCYDWPGGTLPLPVEEGLLSLLFAAGKLPLEEIEVKSIAPVLDSGTETHYNATWRTIL